jgi:hypothetical protein
MTAPRPRAYRYRGARPEHWTVAGWAGMYDSRAKSSEQDGQAPLLINLRPADPDRMGPLELRPGLKRMLAGAVGSTALQVSGACQALFYMPGVGPCAIIGGEIYTLNIQSGTATKVVTQANFTTAGITMSTTTPVIYAFLGSVLVAAALSDRAWTWDGTSGAGGLTSLTNAPASCQALTVYYAKVFMLTTDRTSIQWSEENQPNTGYEAGGFNNSWDLVQTSATHLRAILGTNEGLYVFREDSIAVIRGAVSSTFSTDGVQDGVFIGSGCQGPFSVALAGSGTVWWIDNRHRMHAYRPGVGVIPAWQSLARWLGPATAGATSSIADHTPYGVGEEAFGTWRFSQQMPVVDPVNRRIMFSSTNQSVRTVFVFDSDTAELLYIEQYPSGLNLPINASSGGGPHLAAMPVQTGGTATWYLVYVDEDGYFFRAPLSAGNTSTLIYYDETESGAGSPVVGQLLGPMHGWNTGIEYQFTQLDVIADAALANTLEVGYLTSRRHKLSLTAARQTYSDGPVSNDPYERRVPFGLNANGRWCRPLIRLSGSTTGIETRQLLHGYTLTGYPVSSGPNVT